MARILARRGLRLTPRARRVIDISAGLAAGLIAWPLLAVIFGALAEIYY